MPLTQSGTPPPATLCRPTLVAGAVVTGELFAALLTLAPPEMDSRRWEAFGLHSLVIQWITLLSMALVCQLQRRAPRLRPTYLAIASTLVVMATTSGTALLAIALLPPDAVPDPAGLVLRMIAIALVISTLALLSFREHLASRLALARAKQAELESLQARVRPHFLFNALNSAAALLHARPDEAEDVLLNLGDLFRAALADPGWVPLRHEIDLCRRYLDIEQKRFGERLKVEWLLPEDMDGLSVPLLAVQPLVENAVLHGLELSGNGGPVQIAVEVGPGELEITVRNPVGTNQRSPHQGHGIGLSGVRARVDGATDGTGRLTAEAVGKVFTAHILLPIASMPATSHETIL